MMLPVHELEKKKKKDEIRCGLLTHFPPELSGSQTEWLLLILLQHPPFPEQQTHTGKTLDN